MQAIHERSWRRYKLQQVTLTAVPGIPLVAAGDNLYQVIKSAMDEASLEIRDDDIIVITSKIVSKAEGRLVSLQSIVPSDKAEEIALLSGKDSRAVELMLGEGKVVNVQPGIIEVWHRLGFVCTSAGIDRANTGRAEDEVVSLLPENPDASARRVVDRFSEDAGCRIGVIINDSLGIKYRRGSVGLAIGYAGISGIVKGNGAQTDLYGKIRNVNISFVDEVAAAASLLMGQGNAGIPVVLVKGLHPEPGSGGVKDLIAIEQLSADLGN